MERGETGPGRDAYDLPRRPNAGRPGGGPGGPAERPYEGADGHLSPPEDGEDDYGLLLRRPGEMPSRRQRLRQPGGARLRNPGRFPPSGYPADQASGGAPNGNWPPADAGAYGARSNGGRPGTSNGGTPGGGPGGGGPGGGGPGGGAPGGGMGTPGDGPLGGQAPGYHYRLPNGRRIPPAAYRMYRFQAAGPGPGQDPYGGWNRRAPDPWDSPAPDPPAGRKDPQAGGWNRQADPYGGRRDPQGEDWGRPNADADPRGWNRPGDADPHGRTRQGGAADPFGPGRADPRGWNRPGTAEDPAGQGWGRGRPGPVGGTRGYGGPPGGVPPVPDRARTAGRLSGADAPEPGARAAEADGTVIRQRETALPDKRPLGAAQPAGEPVASIAPDGLESFARDLRALRAKAELEYPEMAETSHYTMKTLASAAGGLRLPTLPVAVAFVRACGGNVAEWEDRWQKLAATITTEAAKKRRGDGEEPAEASPDPVQAPEADTGEVYVITSAKPRQPGW